MPGQAPSAYLAERRSDTSDKIDDGRPIFLRMLCEISSWGLLPLALLVSAPLAFHPPLLHSFPSHSCLSVLQLPFAVAKGEAVQAVEKASLSGFEATGKRAISATNSLLNSINKASSDFSRKTGKTPLPLHP